jgi:polysaccharide biosynthesis transport protein
MDQKSGSPIEEKTNDEYLAKSDHVDSGEVLRIIFRRKFLILGTVTLATIIVAVYVFTVNPKYKAELQVLFEEKSGPVFDFKAAAAGQPQDEASIFSEIEVIRSRNLAWRVISKLSLDQQPEFNSKLRPTSPVVEFIKDKIPLDWLSSFTNRETSLISEDRRRHYDQQRIIDEFLDQIVAKQVPLSRVVLISFTSEHPEIAAEALNTLAELYLVARLEDKFENAQRASTWLASRLQKLRDRVEESERAVEDYRKRYGLFKASRDTLITEQMDQLSSKLLDATIARRAEEANLAQVRHLLNSPNQIETASQVLQSSLVQRFREEELQLDRRQAEMSKTLGVRHPAMIQLKAEKESLQQNIKSEIGKIARALENDLQSLLNREAALSGDLERMKAKMAQANEASVGLNTLDREAEANRVLLEKFLTAFMQTSVQENVESQVPDARIISQAAIPERPLFPNKPFLLATALVGATIVGVLLAFAVEYLDAGFRSAEQLETATGLPVIAHVPFLGFAKLRGEDAAGYILRRPASVFAEAIRSIYTRLVLILHDQPPQVVMLTSALADEGKSTIALALARQQAQAGRRVIAIDTDFRGSGLAHRATGLAEAPGLSEFLAGEATAKEAIQSDPMSPADLIVAGTRKLDNFDIGNSAQLRALLDDLRQTYELIVLDSVPVLALTNAHVLATMADATLLVVCWGKTRRRVVRYAINEINKVGGRIRGAILAQVDLKKHAGYRYGDSGYYYGRSAKYYAD